MASLISELITTLQSETEIYESLIPIEEQKTKVIIKNDLKALQEITEQEQSLINQINHLEHKRQEVVVNIGTVLNRKPETLDLKSMVKLLEKQPEEQKAISQIHDNLKKAIKRLMDRNNQNQSLINQSLEFIEFNLNFIQSTRMSPGNSYNRNASEIDPQMEQTRMFDAKQ